MIGKIVFLGILAMNNGIINQEDNLIGEEILSVKEVVSRDNEEWVINNTKYKDYNTVIISSKEDSSVISIIGSYQKLNEYDKLEFVNNIKGFDEEVINKELIYSRGNENGLNIETFSWNSYNKYYQVIFVESESDVKIITYALDSDCEIPELKNIINLIE